MKRVFIVGNDAFTVHAMRFALRYSTGVNLFGIIEGQGSLPDALKEARPDVVVVDGITDTGHALENVRAIRTDLPGALIILVASELDDASSAQAMEAGAVVCLWRDAEVPAIVGAPQPAAARRPAALAPVPLDEPGDAQESGVPCPLTARELEILRWVAEGHTSARIARKLWVTEQTVKFHLSNIYRKLGVQNRTEASRYALVNDLFGTRPPPARPVGLLPLDGDDAGVYAHGRR
ncbi:MAG: response regulator transcription factor [Solirubrobacterales bacterium]|jgi:DNA-binding NarL/FixJ family response regulator|nr:response regulator transcription factor [Solirubrobacterales bacterium]